MPPFVDLKGKKFGRLTVLSRSKVKTGPNIMWNCMCDCGNKTRAVGGNLKSGNTSSCGCLAFEMRGEKSNTAQKMLKKCGVYIPADSHLYSLCGGIASKCRKEKIKFGFESIAHMILYVEKIIPARCPVMGTKFTRTIGLGVDQTNISIDRINPKLGYVMGNLQVISALANRMKRDANQRELKQFAEWVLREAA